MTHRIRTRALAASACLLLGACLEAGADAPRATAEVTVPGWRLSHAAAVGGAAADPATQLFNVTSVADDAEGRVYVVNFGDKRVSVFDSTGAFVRTLGRTGRGPGEFVAPARLAVVGGEVWVLDAMQGRISRFRRADGSHVADLSLQLGTGLHARDMKTTPDGRLFVELRPVRTARSTGAARPRVLEVDTATGRTLPPTTVALDSAPQVEVRTPTSSTAGMARVMDLPFSPRPVWTVSPGGEVLFGNGAEYVVRRAADGARAELFRAAGERRPVTRWDEEQLFAQPMLKPFRDAVELPDHKPYFTSLLADGERVWVALPAGREGQEWEVRDRAGRLLGQLRLAPRARLLHVSTGTVLVLATDDDDVETLHRFRLRRG